VLERCELVGPDGVPVATYVRATERDGRPYADQLVPCPGAEPATVARAAAEHPALRAALVVAGAQVRGSVELMSVSLVHEKTDLGVEPPHPPSRAPPGVTIGPFERKVPPELGTASFAAFPPSHPDHHADDPTAALTLLRSLVEGGTSRGCRGPHASRLARREEDGQAVGAAIIINARGEPPRSGPYLAQLFRLPGDDLRGLGAALLDAALAAARRDGCETVGLAVNTDNPARGLYLGRGFMPVALSVTLRMPGEPRSGSPARRRRTEP